MKIKIAKVAEMTMLERSPLMLWSILNKQEKRRRHRLAAVVVMEIGMAASFVGAPHKELST
jgi:hypothetical protein